jgi:hypothetical protein
MLLQSVQGDLQAGRLENDPAIGPQSILSRNTGLPVMFRLVMTLSGSYKTTCKKLQVCSFFFFDRISV